MEVSPDYQTVGRLFGDDRTFRVPKYQRNYAWQTEEIGDFKSDLRRCLTAREAGTTRAHFFGGLVTVRQSVPGRQELEVVDGQQRLATFVLLIAQLRRAMLKVSEGVDKDDPAFEAATFLAKKSGMLKTKFQLLSTSINMKVVDLPRLQLSEPDNDFFSRLLAGEKPEIKRKSHEYLQFAFDQLGLFVDEMIANCATTDQAQRLSALSAVVEEDWSVLNMETPTKQDAYTLFQVLNDRGRGLTEGELLRAKTLELLDGPGSAVQSKTVEDAWNEILAHAADDVEDNLRWIYASHTGKRPSPTQLFDDLVAQFFPTSSKPQQTAKDAAAVVNSVRELRKEYALTVSMRKGHWPYTDLHPSVKAWDKDRLKLLTVELEHTNCMPLLIAAASSLGQKEFAEIVQLLERFMFRYKIVVQAHIGPATTLYHKQAFEIRSDPTKYKTQSLRLALKAVIDKHADDGKFAPLFQAMQYGTSPSKKVKYALLTLEHYRPWLQKGANGRAVPDKTHVYDFSNTTVEHVYSQNTAKPVPDLEEVANNIGNLAILGPDANNAVGNKEFADKKATYEKSHFELTKDLAMAPKWDRAAIDARALDLKEMALKVFSF